jgi:hypothetical protein
MLASIQPSAPDAIPKLVDAIAPNLNGSWILNKSCSDSLVPFLKHMGVPWAIQQIAASAKPTRTFELTSRGMIDTQVTTGLMGRTQRQEWSWTETPMSLPMGDNFPGFISFDAEGRLVTKILHAKGPVITIIDSITQNGSEATLILRMIAFDGGGNEVVSVRRVFNRST